MERTSESLGIDETGVTVYFQSQTFKVARFCVRRRVKESEVVDQDGTVDPQRNRASVTRVVVDQQSEAEPCVGPQRKRASVPPRLPKRNRASVTTARGC